MRVTVRRWGNSAAIRIPAAILAAAKVSLDDTLEVREENGCIVITPIRPEKYDLGALLAGITADNLHTEVSFGRAVGGEAL